MDNNLDVNGDGVVNARGTCEVNSQNMLRSFRLEIKTAKSCVMVPKLKWDNHIGYDFDE